MILHFDIYGYVIKQLPFGINFRVLQKHHSETYIV